MEVRAQMDYFESMVTYSATLSVVGAFSEGLNGAIIGAMVGAGIGLVTELFYPIDKSPK